MTATISCATAPYLVESRLTELVKGNELLLLEQILPLVERQCVSLDLHTVTRIDAAGIAALISLYCKATEAGHMFTISNPSRHVREILSLVGLDRILESQNTGELPYFSTQFEEVAA
jgi:anti-anti-sigma factor